MRVEKTLKNEHGGYLVDQCPVFGAVPAGTVQQLVSFGGGQPFVPQVDGHGAHFAQFTGKSLGFQGLRAGFTRKMKRQPGDNGRALMPPEKPPQGAHVVARIAAVERHDRLREQSKRVGRGDADALVADIEAEIAGQAHPVSIRLPWRRATLAFSGRPVTFVRSFQRYEAAAAAPN